MDNDLKIVRFLKKIYKQMKFRIDYRGISVQSEASGNLMIKQLIENESPAMIARCGATEMRCVGEYLATGMFSEKIRKEIQELSGVFPTTDEVLTRFCEYYISCTAKADLLALWGVGAENEVVTSKCTKETKFCKLESLEPYYYVNPWSEALKGKRVLVVHPFVESIRQQYVQREKLFKNPKILPEFKSLVCVKAVQSIAGEKTEFETWFDALDSMKKQISELEFDVAIIGAGAYSLPLASYVKELGKISVQMSGCTQILFGIKGKRWDNIPEVSCLFNDYWIKPSEQETPKGCKKVEGGSYW